MTEIKANKLAVASCVLAIAVFALGLVMPIGPMLHDPEPAIRGRAEGRLIGHIVFAVVGMVFGGIAMGAARRFGRPDIRIKAIIGMVACAAITAVRVMMLVNG
ncbi:hypothetical protein [Humisphaera borealis]|uniref:Uncharacterized protein n=1 Tax=Humisphaera borealis TaxID=2807512 RepID=A0A7M2X263_9BACT|nr:hypothetical protein [Humisphaera borealis]QOV91785.1 hypothetical protein IPV69_10690 [Humisphaera borealis]